MAHSARCGRSEHESGYGTGCSAGDKVFVGGGVAGRSVGDIVGSTTDCVDEPGRTAVEIP